LCHLTPIKPTSNLVFGHPEDGKGLDILGLTQNEILSKILFFKIAVKPWSPSFSERLGLVFYLLNRE
jgi:hypothetical protein